MHLGYWKEDEYTLSTPLETLEGRLAELLRREANGFEAGITCPLKDKGDMTCSACPVSEVGRNTRRSALCRLGREQERIAALIIAKREGVDGE